MSPSTLPPSSKKIPRVKVLSRNLGYDRVSALKLDSLTESTQEFRRSYKSSSHTDEASLRCWAASGTQEYFRVMAQDFCNEGYGDKYWPARPDKDPMSRSSVPVWPKDDEKITTALQQLFWRQNSYEWHNPTNRAKRRQGDVSDTSEDEAPSLSFPSSGTRRVESNPAADLEPPRAASYRTYFPNEHDSMTASSADELPQESHGPPRPRVDSQVLDAPELREPVDDQLHFARQSSTAVSRGLRNFGNSVNRGKEQSGRKTNDNVLECGLRAPVANMIRRNTISAETQQAESLSPETSKFNANSPRRSRPDSEEEDETYTPTKKSKRKKSVSKRSSGSTTKSRSPRNQAVASNQATQETHTPSKQAKQRHRHARSTNTSPSSSLPIGQSAISTKQPSDGTSKHPQEASRSLSPGDNSTSDPLWMNSSNPDGGSSTAAESILPSSTTQIVPEQDKNNSTTDPLSMTSSNPEAGSSLAAERILPFSTTQIAPEQHYDRHSPLNSDKPTLDSAEGQQAFFASNVNSHTSQAGGQEQSLSLSESAKATPAQAPPAARPAISVRYMIITSRFRRVKQTQWLDGSLDRLSLDALLDKLTILTGKTNIQQIDFLLRTSMRDIGMTALRDIPTTFDDVRDCFIGEMREDLVDNGHTKFVIYLEPDPPAPSRPESGDGHADYEQILL